MVAIDETYSVPREQSPVDPLEYGSQALRGLDVSLLPKQRTFLRALAYFGNMAEAARLAECSRQSWYDWVEANPDLQPLFDAAQQAYADRLEARVRQRALDDEKPSDLMLMFATKAKRPEYRDNYNPQLTLNDNSIHITISYNRVDPRLSAPSDPQLPSPDANTTSP